MPDLYALTSQRWRPTSLSSLSKNATPSPIRIGMIEYRTSLARPRRRYSPETAPPPTNQMENTAALGKETVPNDKLGLLASLSDYCAIKPRACSAQNSASR